MSIVGTFKRVGSGCFARPVNVILTRCSSEWDVIVSKWKARCCNSEGNPPFRDRFFKTNRMQIKTKINRNLDGELSLLLKK